MKVFYRNPNPLYAFEKEVKIHQTNGYQDTNISIHQDEQTGELWVVENSLRWGKANHYICKLDWLVSVSEDKATTPEYRDTV